MKYAAMVKETTTTTGTGELTLAGAVSGFQAFIDSDNVSDEEYVSYYLLDGNGTDWEYGAGWLNASGGELARSRIFESTNSGSVINLSAGTHTVMCAPQPPLIGQRYGCLVEVGGSQNITDTVSEDIYWSTEVYDTDYCHSASSQFIYVPLWCDAFQVDFTLSLYGGAVSSLADIYVQLEGSSNIANFPLQELGNSHAGIADGDSVTITYTSPIMHKTVSDTVTSVWVNVANESGATLTITQGFIRLQALA